MSNAKFSIVPDHEQLERLQRDLRFFPSHPKRLSVLSQSDVDSYNRDGYLTGIRIFDRDEIDSIRAYFDQLIQRILAAGGDSYSISSAHLSYGRVYDVLTDARIVDRVSDLLGSNVIAWGSHFFCKMPHDGRTVAWHQDASYWPLTPSKAITVWLAIDGADRENACMRFVSGSHRGGHIEYRSSADAEGNVLDQTVDDPERFGEVVDIELEAGQASMHSDLLLHGSEANRSNRRRCGLTLRYCPADVRAHLGWNKKGVIVRGSDDSGHWSNHQRVDG